MSKVTIRDVTKRAGVGLGTVFRVINQVVLATKVRFSMGEGANDLGYPATISKTVWQTVYDACKRT